MRRYACLIPLAASFSRSKDSSLMMCSILQALASATSGSTPAAISCSVKNKGEILIHLERSMIELWILSSFSGAVNAVASSKLTMGASFRMQRTIEMRCFSPPERVAPPCQPLFNHILMDRHTAEGRKSSCQLGWAQMHLLRQFFTRGGKGELAVNDPLCLHDGGPLRPGCRAASPLGLFRWQRLRPECCLALYFILRSCPENNGRNTPKCRKHPDNA